jgi:catecholate siderophore receptor
MAYAQPDTPDPATAKTLKGVQVNGTISDDSYLPTIDTTATHVATAPIDIPLSIQAIPAKLLNDQGALSLEDAVRNAPGVSVHQGEGNRDQFLLRGISTKSDFFVDGMRDDSEYFRDIYNVSEVDVLQGPSALLFGRGNAGGVVNLVTKQAGPQRIRSLSLDVGSWGLRRATLDIGDALDDGIAWRVNAMNEQSGGFRDHADAHRKGINPTLALRLGSTTRLDLGVEHLHEWQRADRGIPSQNGRPANVPRSTLFGSLTQNSAQATVDAFNARLTHDFSDTLQLRNTLRISHNDKFYRNLYPGSAVAGNGTVTMSGYAHANTRQSYLDQAELLADFDTGALTHQLLLGGDFAWQQDIDRKLNSPSISGVPVTDPLVDGKFNKLDRDNEVTGRELGFYAQDQVSLGEHWLAVLGARWSRFALDANYHLLPPTRNSTRHVDTSWSPRAGLIYKPVPNDSIYLSATRSFTPQGANLAISAKSPTGQNLDPQKAVNYEFGNKLDLFDGQLSLTAALFQLELSNVNSPDPNDPTQLVQTGAQRSRGVAFTLTGQLTPRWNIAANYSHLNAQLTRTTTDAAAGAKVGLVPREQTSIWTTYALTPHWGVGGGVSAQSRVYTSFSNKVVLHGYASVDGMAYYEQGNYRLQLNVGNLFDRHYYASASGDNQIMPADPRNVQLKLRVNF